MQLFRHAQIKIFSGASSHKLKGRSTSILAGARATVTLYSSSIHIYRLWGEIVKKHWAPRDTKSRWVLWLAKQAKLFYSLWRCRIDSGFIQILLMPFFLLSLSFLIFSFPVFFPLFEAVEVVSLTIFFFTFFLFLFSPEFIYDSFWKRF